MSPYETAILVLGILTLMLAVIKIIVQLILLFIEGIKDTKK